MSNRWKQNQQQLEKMEEKMGKPIAITVHGKHYFFHKNQFSFRWSF